MFEVNWLLDVDIDTLVIDVSEASFSDSESTLAAIVLLERTDRERMSKTLSSLYSILKFIQF
ncbi:3114_t:CDS:2 [Gigaspora margarita]|uniref:3114_t:CDS:1 n=1 Tax=Gigaspora margarita TaxID=4874 RepID=A0ABN7UEM7_GIGMA|nr:3114_t:CDS:2 [Gigaspora margarita]